MITGETIYPSILSILWLFMYSFYEDPKETSCLRQHHLIKSNQTKASYKMGHTKKRVSIAELSLALKEFILSFIFLVTKRQSVGTEWNKYRPSPVEQPGAQQRWQATQSDHLWACPLRFCVLAATFLSHCCHSIIYTKAWLRFDKV